MNSDQLLAVFPEQVARLFKLGNQAGFDFYFVGGGPRDFLNGKSDCFKDLDCEVQSAKTNEPFEDFWSRFKTFIQEQFGSERTKSLPFNIIKLDFEGIELEFTPARKEVFYNHQIGHKNFEAQFFSRLAPDICFLRRDFTVNTISFLWRSENKPKICDPYNGREDLRHKILRTKNPRFDKDPIRFLRAIRFKLNLNLEYDQDLLELLKGMNIDRISDHYKKLELVKCLRPFLFASHWKALREQSEDLNIDETKADQYNLIYQQAIESSGIDGFFEFLVIFFPKVFKKFFYPYFKQELFLTGRWKKFARLIEQVGKFQTGQLPENKLINEWQQFQVKDQGFCLQRSMALSGYFKSLRSKKTATIESKIDLLKRIQ
jgi:hypothetical protein